jgi:hypothetical protein
MRTMRPTTSCLSSITSSGGPRRDRGTVGRLFVVRSAGRVRLDGWAEDACGVVGGQGRNSSSGIGENDETCLSLDAHWSEGEQLQKRGASSLVATTRLVSVEIGPAARAPHTARRPPTILPVARSPAPVACGHRHGLARQTQTAASSDQVVQRWGGPVCRTEPG